VRGTGVQPIESEMDRRNELESSIVPLNVRDRSGLEMNSSVSLAYINRRSPMPKIETDQHLQ